MAGRRLDEGVGGEADAQPAVNAELGRSVSPVASADTMRDTTDAGEWPAGKLGAVPNNGRVASPVSVWPWRASSSRTPLRFNPRAEAATYAANAAFDAE